MLVGCDSSTPNTGSNGGTTNTTTTGSTTNTNTVADPADTAAYGNWSQWSPASTTNTSVMTINQTRTRSCSVSVNGIVDNPAATCSGNSGETRSITNPAYIDTGSDPADPADTAAYGNWSQWSPASITNTSVMTINQTRTRICAVTVNGNADNPARTCIGNSSETRTIANPNYLESGSGSANLIVSSFTASPTSVLTNAQIELDYTVRNSGSASSELATLSYYSSSNSNITTSDTKIGERNIIALSPGGESSFSNNTFNAPATAGTYYYGACVTESNTTNCSDGATISVSVSVGIPDLTISSFTVSNTTPTPGQSISLNATVRNSGTLTSASTTLRYYRSTNASITASDTPVGTDTVSSLAAGNTGNESINISVPSSAGTYYYGACVVSVSNETDISNNCSTGASVVVAISGNGGDNSTDCVVVNNTITIAEGSQCTFTASIVSTYNLSSFNNTSAGTSISCSGGKVRLGGITTTTLTLNGLTVVCG